MPTVVTYGMGVHWALNAAEAFEGQIEVIDLRTLYPLDEEAIFTSVRKTNRCLVLTEEATNSSFARSLAGLIQEKCFTALDAPVMTMGSENLPAIPLNSVLEEAMLPNVEKVEGEDGGLVVVLGLADSRSCRKARTGQVPSWSLGTNGGSGDGLLIFIFIGILIKKGCAQARTTASIMVLTTANSLMTLFHLDAHLLQIGQ